MSDIPTELFLDILKHVPVESLFRFKSVCKTWLRIIDDPTFAKLHINRGLGQYWNFYVSQKNGKVFILPVNKLFCAKGIHFVNATNIKTLITYTSSLPETSCNGIILFHGKRELTWRICNPFTGESLEIGQYDGLDDYNGIGIGYDEANDDYKVVKIDGVCTHIYSVNANAWRIVDDFPGRIMYKNGVYAFGAFHWFDDSNGVEWIVALDLSTENYRKIALPSEIAQLKSSYLVLTYLSGCLFLSCSPLNGGFHVWMNQDYGYEEKWVKTMYLEKRYSISLVAYLKSYEHILLSQGYGKYLCYDLGKKCVAELGINVNQDGFGTNFNGTLFYSEAFPANLSRLKRSNVSDESIASQGAAKRQRRTDVSDMVIERLPLKSLLGGEDQPFDDSQDIDQNEVINDFNDESEVIEDSEYIDASDGDSEDTDDSGDSDDSGYSD